MKIIGVFAFALIIVFVFVRTNGENQDHRYRIMFYNVENLFDTYNDSLKADDDFTPGGRMHWTSARFKSKINNLSKVIIAAGEWQPPVVVGLCEVENLKVINRLIYETPLGEFDYKPIHFESSDGRGIDVALIYREKFVRILHSSAIRIKKHDLFTRDILYCKAKIEDEIFHIFINHWPSRSAGQIETEELRMAASQTLRHAIDSLFNVSTSEQVIILGDLNDEPTDISVEKGLLARSPGINIEQGTLYNLSRASKGQVKGTLKYQGVWNIFDQIIVSGGLLEDDGLNVQADGYRIFHTPMMIETDKTYNGVKPFRTYLGFRYHGGYSDHLPVYVDICRE